MRIEHPPFSPSPRPRPAGPVFKANKRIPHAWEMVNIHGDHLEGKLDMVHRKTPTLADEWATAKRIITKWLRGGYA